MQHPWKIKAPYALKQMWLSLTSSLVNPCYVEDCVMIRVKLSTLPLSTMHWNMRRTCPLFHACTTYTWTKIQDPLSIVITSSTLKRKKLLSSHKILHFFENLFTHRIYHLPTYPIRPMFLWIFKNIELNKQFMHCCVIYHGTTMTKQVEYQSKLHNCFSC
jgi:hypothetical protein